MDWGKILRAVSPRAKAAVVDSIAPHFDDLFKHYSITDAVEQAVFMAQAACETDGFRTLEEYGNAAYFKRYDGRKSLGNTKRGDGYRFRGQGIFDLTGRANFKHYGDLIKVDLVDHPELSQDGYNAVLLACIYWTEHHCGPLARAGDVRAVTRKINGGLNGLKDRIAYFAKFKKAVAAAHAAEGREVHPGLSAPDEVSADATILPADEIAELQKRLDDLGYHMVAGCDGMVGTSTVAAIAAYQHDKGLPNTGTFDDATIAALRSDDNEKRPIPDDRATGTPHDAPILDGAGHLLTGAGAIGVGGAVTAANSALSNAEAAKGYVDRVQALVEPLAFLKSTVFSVPGMAVIAVIVAAGIAFYAIRIRHLSLSNYREHKTAY